MVTKKISPKTMHDIKIFENVQMEFYSIEISILGITGSLVPPLRLRVNSLFSRLLLAIAVVFDALIGQKRNEETGDTLLQYFDQKSST